MRIGFVGAGLEPGTDGVGDYIRLLAGEIARRGSPSCVVALSDSRVDAPREELQVSVGTSIPSLRLPRAFPLGMRIALARDWLGKFDLDWVSLQFVPFAFHPKGLPLFLSGRIRQLHGNVPLHLMFHELWVGFRPNRPLKERCWGKVQRRLIRRMARGLSPAVVHTTNELYVAMLASIGVAAEQLPLFGNIPVSAPSGWFAQELDRLGITASERDRWLVLGVFGSVHDAWTPESWLEHLVRRAGSSGRRVAIVGIGNLKGRDSDLFQKLGEISDRIVVRHFGCQMAPKISDFLQTIDAGISTMERSLLGKSGSAAAMREHGVPILVTRTDDEPDRESAIARVLRDIEMLVRDCHSRRTRPIEGSPLAMIAATLVERLGKVDGNASTKLLKGGCER